MLKTDRYVQTEAAGMLYRLIPVTEEIIRCVIGKEEIKGNDSLIIEKKEYPSGVSFLRVAEDYREQVEDDIVLVVYNHRLRELGKCATEDGTVEFVTTADKTGKKTYSRSQMAHTLCTSEK